MLPLKKKGTIQQLLQQLPNSFVEVSQNDSSFSGLDKIGKLYLISLKNSDIIFDPGND